MNELQMYGLYVMTYRGCGFKYFKDTDFFFNFLNEKLGDNYFKISNKGRKIAYIQCFDNRLSWRITRSNGTIDRLVAKCHKVFRRNVESGMTDLKMATLEAIKETNFVAKYYKQFTIGVKREISLEDFKILFTF
ncbi:hypothetical protein [Spiroplasma sp. BIUS-1]|uniref:hypothetical protein n=1 Tax=Spiroplasma sp. BIUS-1 TaxID=216964 RepID=UPI0013983B5F|nr:hypothetical protein [Spiroplasma sp. BIUS-1]QHX36767.1 hypothetical protein SBIUS_v1c05140 [Spiroplasma sp. BIUS-1]